MPHTLFLRSLTLDISFGKNVEQSIPTVSVDEQHTYYLNSKILNLLPYGADSRDGEVTVLFVRIRYATDSIRILQN